MGIVRVVNDEPQFVSELNSAGTNLVVVDFTATWYVLFLIEFKKIFFFFLSSPNVIACLLNRCGPCQRIAPVFEQLSGKYPNAIFLKVDVDKCAETAAARGVSSMPTFIFYKNNRQLGRCQGADPAGLENMIKQFYGSGDTEETETPVAGHVREGKDNLYYHVFGMIFIAVVLYIWSKNDNN